jgi:hypothetical protein
VSEDESRLPVVASFVLMVGAGSLPAGPTDLSVWSTPLVVVGAAVTIPALRRIVPAGTLTARRGVPAASAAAFLASAGFIAIDGFLTLMLTETRGLSIGKASLVKTTSALAWGRRLVVAVEGDRAHRVGASPHGVRRDADRDRSRWSRSDSSRCRCSSRTSGAGGWYRLP